MSQISKAQAVKEFWYRGNLFWKLHSVQKEMYKVFYGSEKNSTLVWLISRQLGKSFLLTVLAIEQCLKQKNSVVKILTDTKVHAKMIFEPLFKDILDDCPEELKPRYSEKDYTYNFPNGSVVQLAGSDNGHYERLRGQRCLAEDTPVLTPFGPKPIQDIKPGDIVYGVNKDGSVSETTVKALYNNGYKEVTDLTVKGRPYISATGNHRFLGASVSSINRYNPIYREISVDDFNTDSTRISKITVKIPCGTVNEPHAYALGAMIGDGCCSLNGNQLYIASETHEIPEKVAKVIGLPYKKCSSRNYTWGIGEKTNSYNNMPCCPPVKMNWYHEWLKGKRAWEKNFDWDVVNTWDRESCLNLLAGLIDTDGSVYCRESENTLELNYASCNLELIKNVNKLIFKLFQVRPHTKRRSPGIKDKRLHYLSKIRSGIHVKRILRELSPYLVLERKRYQDKYDQIHSKEMVNFVKVEKGEKRYCNTYDIEVNNETHLYLTGDGWVTHNSNLVLVDEAGFCDNLDYVISSVLFPTTTHTGGRIVLASTPSPDPDHDFLKFIEKSDLEGLLTKKTLFDNPLLSKEQVDRIIKEMGGVDSVKFRREYKCELIKDDVLAIIPEFDEVAEKELVKEWERPPFFDSYVSMDLGGRDLTALLFGYYDFLKDKVVIEDELIMDFNKSENTIKSLTERLLQKEISLYTDPQTGETKAPYQRVSDINYIVTQEISRYSNNTVHFINPRKDDKDAAINQLRALITTKKIIIHPRCKTLIRHLKNAKWNKSKTSFARSPDNGHYDCVDALIYLIRSISYTKNPYPNNYNIDTRNLFQTNKPSSNPYQTSQLSSAVEVFKKAFKVK